MGRTGGTIGPRADAYAVAGTVGENPTRWGIGIVDDPAACGEHRGNALLDLLASNGQVDVRCVSQWLGWYSWIENPGVVDDRRVAHRRGVTDMPGLYFVGLSWQHTRGSALLGFVNDDAACLADHITTH